MNQNRPQLDKVAQDLDRLWVRVERCEDRVARLYAQSRVYVMNAKSLERGWLGLGAEANGGKLADGSALEWVREIAEQLGFSWPLPTDQPDREDMLYGKQKRFVLSGLWALNEEVISKNVTRIEPDYKWHQDPQQRERKPECFTVIFRLGESGNRVEKYVSAVLNHVLTQRNRERPGILMWRAKTRSEKRARAQQRQAAGNGDGVANQGKGKQGRGKGRGRGGKGGRKGRGK